MTTTIYDPEDHRGGFPEDAFPPQNNTNFKVCDLRNENLFPINKFLMFRSGSSAAVRAYAMIEPALLLISRVIMQRSSSFSIFVRRRDAGQEDVFLDSDAELEVSNQETIDNIKWHIPDVEFDPDMASNSPSFAQTILHPKSTSDLITLDYDFIRLLKAPTAHDTQRLAALFFLAILLGHEMAHVLEFRCVHAGQLRNDQEPFKTPPGITCREAGTAWELRAFGGRIYPVCQPQNSIANMCGLCIRSSSWDFGMMKVNEDWIRCLFTESYWRENSQRQGHPLRPPIDIFAGYAILEDKLIESQAKSSKRKARKTDVQVETGSPRRKPRFQWPSNTGNKCGGKRVQMNEG
ncbi:hypothetical protein BJX76DRAFT_221182 [Aspergillus varians]